MADGSGDGSTAVGVLVGTLVGVLVGTLVGVLVGCGGRVGVTVGCGGTVVGLGCTVGAGKLVGGILVGMTGAPVAVGSERGGTLVGVADGLGSLPSRRRGSVGDGSGLERSGTGVAAIRAGVVTVTLGACSRRGVAEGDIPGDIGVGLWLVAVRCGVLVARATDAVTVCVACR
jgi:hypothetical protein